MYRSTKHHPCYEESVCIFSVNAASTVSTRPLQRQIPRPNTRHTNHIAGSPTETASSLSGSLRCVEKDVAVDKSHSSGLRAQQ